MLAVETNAQAFAAINQMLSETDFVNQNTAGSGGRRELRGNPLDAAAVPASNRKDIRFRQTLSTSTTDAPEASSFIDMLKSTKKMVPQELESGVEHDGGKGNNKRKGKKGRQIDPSLLGFKVHSNRIMMGEIQRPDD